MNRNIQDGIGVETSVSRRNFLLTTGGMALGALFFPVISKANDGVGDIIDLVSLKEYQSSIQNVGKKQVEKFCELIEIRSGKKFLETVKTIQIAAELPVTGILNWETLSYIKRKIYIKAPSLVGVGLYTEIPTDSLLAKAKDAGKNTQIPGKVEDPIEEIWEKEKNSAQQERLSNEEFIRKNKKELHKFLKEYPRHPKKIYNPNGRVVDVVHVNKKSIPSAYDNNYFYGENVGRNKSNTYLNESLFEKVGNRPSKNHKTYIAVNKIGGKNYLEMYVDGKLEVLTYVSIGKLSSKTAQIPASEKGYTDISMTAKDEYYISTKSRGAPMPHALQLNNSGYFIHGGRVNGKPRSGGCIRVPGLYHPRIFELAKMIGIGKIPVFFIELY